MSKSNMKTIVTYKQNEKWIYDIVQQHSGKGNWVKDILSAYLSGKLVHNTHKNSPLIQNSTGNERDCE